MISLPFVTIFKHMLIPLIVFHFFDAHTLKYPSKLLLIYWLFIFQKLFRKFISKLENFYLFLSWSFPSKSKSAAEDLKLNLAELF